MNIVEQQLLSVFAYDWERTNHLFDRVDEGLFAGYEERKLFREMIELKDVGVSMEGLGYPEIISDVSGLPSYAESYIETLIEDRKRRQVMLESENAVERCKSGDDLHDIISSLSTSLVGLVDVSTEVTTDTIIADYREAAAGNIKSIPHPYENLTRLTGGIKRGMVTVLTGRSKSGKSMYKSFWHKYLGDNGIPALDCCFEDGISIAKGRCASIGKYNSSELANGGRYVNVHDKWEWWQTRGEALELAEQSLRELDELPMYWHEKRCAPKDMLTVVSEYVSRYKVQCVFIDGAKDMLRPSGKHNDCGFEEEASQALVDMAQRLNVAVVVIHHLTKMHNEELITVSNVRGSSNIISDCRSVYALQGNKSGASLSSYSDETFWPRTFDEDGNCSTRVFECLENNHGKAGKIWLETDLGKCMFEKKQR